MKKGLLFGTLLSCLVLAGCASNDGPAKDESSKDSTSTSEQTSQESSKDSSSVESSQDSSSVESSKDSSSSSSSEVVEVAPTKVSLSTGDKTYLLKDNTLKLTASFKPKETTNKDVTWESSAPDIVSVENGLLTAKALGEAVIKVTSVANPSVTDTTTVYSQSIPTDFTFEVKGEAVTELKVDLEGTLKPDVKGVGDHASNSGSWTVEDTTIATVTNWGQFTGVKEGTTTATYTSKHDNTIKKTVNLTVAKAPLVDKPTIDFEESIFATGYDDSVKPIEVMLNGTLVKITKNATQFSAPSNNTKAAIMQGSNKIAKPATLEFDFGTTVVTTFKFDAKIWSEADSGLISTQIAKIAVEHFVDGAWVEASVVDASTLKFDSYKNFTATVNSSKVRIIITKTEKSSSSNCRICIDNVTNK